MDDVTAAIQQAIDACLLFSDTAKVSDVQLYLAANPGIRVSDEQIKTVLRSKPSYTELPGGGAIVQGHGIEVGFMQVQIPGKSEQAWMYWVEDGTTSEHRWSWSNRFWAIAQINAALEAMGLALNGDMQITEF